MSYRATILAVLATSALTSGCASSARITPNLALPAAFQAPAAPAGMAPAPLDAWWASFSDPALTALVETALKASPDARTATLRLQEAIATRRGLVDTEILPSGQVNGSTAKGNSEVSGFTFPGFSQSGDTRNASANFNISWELDYLNRRGDAIRTANSDLAAVRFNSEAAKASLAANVAQLYFQLRALDVQLDNARETGRVQGALADLATRKAKVGIGTGADADRVAGDLAQAKAQITALEAQQQAARRSLLILIGRGTDPVQSLPLPPAVVVIPAPLATTPGDLLTRRPDVREAFARLASAAGRLKLDEKALFPTLNLNPGLGYSKSELPGFTTTTKSWTLGVGVSVPVMNLPRLKTEIDAQGARVDQAALAYEKAVQTAYGEAENALTQLDADRRRVALLTDGEVRARRAYDAANRRYADGVDDLTQALSAEQSWRATRSALTSAQADAQQRAVQAFKALGGGWTSTQTPQTSAQAARTETHS